MPTLDDYARDWGATVIEESGGLASSSTEIPAFVSARRAGVKVRETANITFELFNPQQVAELVTYLRANVINVPVPLVWPGESAAEAVRILTYDHRNPSGSKWVMRVRVERWKGVQLPS